MTQGYLIDTCIWIDVEQVRIGPADVATITGEAPVFLSPITLAALKLGVEVCTDLTVKQQRQVTLRRMLRKPTIQINWPGFRRNRPPPFCNKAPAMATALRIFGSPPRPYSTNCSIRYTPSC